MIRFVFAILFLTLISTGLNAQRRGGPIGITPLTGDDSSTTEEKEKSENPHWVKGLKKAKSEKKFLIIDTVWPKNFLKKLTGKHADAAKKLIKENFVIINHWASYDEDNIRSWEDRRGFLRYPRAFRVYDLEKNKIFENNELCQIAESPQYTGKVLLLLLKLKLELSIKSKKDQVTYDSKGFKAKKGKTVTLSKRLGLSSGKVKLIEADYFVLESREKSIAVPYIYLKDKELVKYGIEEKKVSTDDEANAEKIALKSYDKAIVKIFKTLSKHKSLDKKTEKYFKEYKTRVVKKGVVTEELKKKIKGIEASLNKGLLPIMDSVLEMAILADETPKLNAALLESINIFEKNIAKIQSQLDWIKKEKSGRIWTRDVWGW